jgi:hypothetical protein
VGHRLSSSALPHTKQYAFGPGTIGAGPSSFGAGSGSGGGAVGGRAGSVGVGPVSPTGTDGTGSVGDDEVVGFVGSGEGDGPTVSLVAAAAEGDASASLVFEDGVAGAAGFFAGGGSSFFFRRKNDIGSVDEEKHHRSVAQHEVTVFRTPRYRSPWRPPPASG